MSQETKCGDCAYFRPDNQDLPENGGICLKMLLKEVYPNHSPFYTLESHYKFMEALSLSVDPKDTCFQKRIKRLVDLSCFGIINEAQISEKFSLN